MRKLTSTFRLKFSSRKYRFFALAGIIVGVCVLFFCYTEIPAVLTPSEIRQLNQVTTPTSGQKVLVFSPHPDDETIAVGGYIAQSIRNGADVRIVLVTNGDKYHQGAVRYAEFKRATGILGVPETNLVFLNLPDGKLKSENETVLCAFLQAQIDQYNPDIVVYPHPKDYHPDHAAIGAAVYDILKTEPRYVAAYEYIVHYEILYPQPRKFDPNLYLLPPKRLATFDKEWLSFALPQDIESCKEQAVLTYQSQLHNLELNGLLLSYIRRNELLAVPKM